MRPSCSPVVAVDADQRAGIEYQVHAAESSTRPGPTYGTPASAASLAQLILVEFAMGGAMLGEPGIDKAAAHPADECLGHNRRKTTYRVLQRCCWAARRTLSGSDTVTRSLLIPQSILMYEWRWRESNPRPRATNQAFSGRSWLGVFSAPALAPARRRQAQSQFMFPAKSWDHAQQVSLLDEARVRDGGSPGLTRRSLFRQRERRQCA